MNASDILRLQLKIVDGKRVERLEIVTSDDLAKTCLGSDRELYVHAHLNKVKPCSRMPGVELTDENALPQLLDAIETKSYQRCHEVCYDKEKTTGLSPRLIKNKEWANPSQGNRHIEIFLSNECNASCIYCTPVFSSKWEKEIESSTSPLPAILRINRLPSKLVNGKKVIEIRKANERETQSAIKVISDLGRDYSRTACVSINGGEPLLNIIEDDHLGMTVVPFYNANRLWGRMIRYDLNTNLNVSEERLREVIAYLDRYSKLFPFLEIVIQPSIDSLYENFNYVRFGNDFATVERNLDIILRETNYEVEIRAAIHPVTIPQTKEFMQYLNEKAKAIRKFKVYNMIVYYHIPMLNGEFSQYLNDAITYINENEMHLENTDVNLTFFKQLIDILDKNTPTEEQITNAIELFEWFKVERGQDLESVCPELHHYLTKMSLK